jgi:hypothetical protein
MSDRSGDCEMDCATFSNGIAGEFQNPYTVLPFGEDVPAYVDRTHQWNGATVDLPLPSYLVGGEYIMIGNDNRDNANLRLDITVTEDVLVYMLIDNRLTDGGAGDPPESGLPFDQWTGMKWMATNNFSAVMTGWNRTADPNVPDEIGVDEGGDGVGSGNGINNWSSVYSTERTAGTFSIYQPDNGGRNMYGVVIKRKPGSLNSPPEIVLNSPTNNTLFYNAATGVSFNVTTTSPNAVAPAGIKLVLNGTNVTGLTVGGTSDNRTVTFNGLQAGNVYQNGSTTAAAAQLLVDDVDVTAQANVTPTATGFVGTYEPPGTLAAGGAHSVRLILTDSAGAKTTNDWTFTVGAAVALPTSIKTAVGTGTGSGFNIHITKILEGVSPALVNSSARAEQQLAGTLADSTGVPYDNERSVPTATVYQPTSF